MALGPDDKTILPNSFFNRVIRMLYDDYEQAINIEGLLLIAVPSAFLLVVFFVIKKYSGKKVLFWYAVLSLAAYMAYLKFISNMFLIV